MDHSFDLSPKEAIELQKKLQEKVRLVPLPADISYIGGCDVSMNLFSKHVFAGFVVLSFPDLAIVDRAVVEADVAFPYIPGLLSFREIPPLLKAWGKLSIKPDVICVDGVGIAHPRRMGIATHLGLILDTPTIGVAKNVLIGTYEDPGKAVGSSSSLYDRFNPQDIIGVALRTKEKSRPIFISPGHKITLEDAERVVRMCVKGYKIPEPTRLAHELMNEHRKKANEMKSV